MHRIGPRRPLCQPASRETRDEIMRSANEYRILAKECMREAQQTANTKRKKMLLNVAQLYRDIALKVERGISPPKQSNKGG